MTEDFGDLEERTQRFISDCIKNNLVWGLESKEGWAVSASNDFEDAQVMPFWSEESEAKLNIKSEWAGFKAASIPLNEFIENWLVGLYNDELLVGTNWDTDMFGSEFHPLELALDIIEAAQDLKIELKFTRFDSMAILHTQLNEVLSEDIAEGEAEEDATLN